MEFEVGQRVGDYEIVGTPGADGPGKAYRVRNAQLDRTEALVVLLSDLAAQPDLAARLVTESGAMAGFDHPNIPHIYSTFPADNRLLMTREIVEGLPLDQLIQQAFPAPNQAVLYVSQVLSALSYAHGRGVVHGNLRPANITVSSEGNVKLMNFGSAGAANDSANPTATIEARSYMAPEQAQGAGADVRSDLYSVGTVLYELLAGRRPFTANTAEGLLDQERNATLPAPVEINPAVPTILNDIVLTALAKNPLQRFQNANAFRNALQHVLPSLSPPPPASVQIPVAGAIPAAAAIPVVVATAGAAEIPAAVAPPVFQNVALPAAALPPQAAAGHRGLWISLGAIVALAVLLAAAMTLPHFLKGRATATQAEIPPAPQIAGNPSSVTATAPAAAPMQERADAPASPAATSAPAPATSPAVNQVAPGGAQPNPVAPARQPHPSYSPSPQPVPGQPGLMPAAPPSAPAGPSDQEVEQARDELAGLDARASVVSSSVERLRSEQNADGLDLRQDMAGAYARMNVYLRNASADLQSRNISDARSQMDKADREITTLEGLFRR